MVKNASGNEAWRPDDNSPESAWEGIEIPNPVQSDQEKSRRSGKLERDALGEEDSERETAWPGHRPHDEDPET